MSEHPADAHRSLREQLGVYALGHGTADERAAVRAHLEGCAACRSELASLAPLATRLAAVDPDRLDELPAPPPGLADAVLLRVAEEEAGSRRDPDAHRVRNRALAGLAAVGIAAASFGVGWLVRPVPDPSPLEAVAVEVAAEDVSASADVVPHTWGMEVKLSGQGFTAGEVYRVSVTESDGDAIPAGEFLGVGPGRLDCNLNSSVLRQDAVGFEVADSDGSVVLRSSF
ncbi:MAG: zf-HC2 domain-containing protein [Blastococcus sp.]|nr:zf-HC2 domain-containing protein [Blastococcus sp.]